MEYSTPRSKIVKIIRVTIETLTGIPSIVYGLFGFLFYVTFLKWRFSLLAGAATLALMILPVIIRTTEEALLSVSNAFREASFGLGAGKLRTIFKVVLPSALNGGINNQRWWLMIFFFVFISNPIFQPSGCIIFGLGFYVRNIFFFG